jgi:DNA-directed RNA polymerase subunit M/transcription elongation factor TFIIS
MFEMTTDKQTYHLKRPCPQCGELLHFRKSERKELFCPVCGLVDTYHFDASEIFFYVQKQRRKEKRSAGKEILADRQRFPVLIKSDYWLVYDLGYNGKIYLEAKSKEYDFVLETGVLNHFQSISGLIDYMNERASNISVHGDGEGHAARDACVMVFIPK